MQTVNDLLAVYVGAASQQVIRIARTFDTEVIAFWSQLIKRDATSRLFHLPLKLGGLGVGSAVQRHAAAPWRAWQSVVPTLTAATQSPDVDTLPTSTPQLCAQLVATSNRTFTTDEQARPPPQVSWSSPPHEHHPKEARHIHSITTTKKLLVDSRATAPISKAILISQTSPHTGAHLQLPNTEAYEAEDRSFRVSMAKRLMLPHPAASDTSGVASACPN